MFMIFSNIARHSKNTPLNSTLNSNPSIPNPNFKLPSSIFAFPFFLSCRSK